MSSKPPSDKESFKDLIKSSERSLLVLASAIVGRSDAHDVYQEACMIAFRRIDQYEADTNFTAWMATILRFTASNYLRSKRRYSLKLQNLFSFFARKQSDNPSDHYDSARGISLANKSSQKPTSLALLSDLTDAIDEELLNAIQDLDELPRICFLLRTVQDHSYAELSEILQIPEVTVRSHVFRAKKSLLTKLGNKLGGSHG